MDCSALRSLGVRFGGAEMLQKTLATLTKFALAAEAAAD